jgi:hypothetical protein
VWHKANAVEVTTEEKMSTHCCKFGYGVLLLAISAACGGGEDDPSAGGTGDTIGTGGAVATGGAEPKAVTIITPDPGTPTGTLADADTDHDRIQGCWSQTACPASFAQILNDFYTKIDQPRVMCVMLGLSERTPGLYLHNVTSNSARGTDSTEHAFLVLDDGTVIHTSKRTAAGSQSELQGTAGVTYTDAERCDLVDSGYFDDCRAAAEVSDAPTFDALGWVCLYNEAPTAWLANCQPTTAACE